MAPKDNERDAGDDEPNSSDEEGIDIMNSDGDSSDEEEDEDSEEERRIREGFIADDADDDERERRRKRKKKKRKHKEREFEALSEDDLDLVEQNTGLRIDRPEVRKLKKLKRAGAAEESEDEEDAREPDLSNIFDDIQRRNKPKDKRRARDDVDILTKANRAADMDDMEEDDMADFIEEDSPDEEAGADREQRIRRKAKDKEAVRRKKVAGIAFGGLNITAEAWDEIQEVFGDGHDYDDALESDGETSKAQPTLRDVFEPAEIAERMMTDADDIIRALDMPERMQIAQASIQPKPTTLVDGEVQEASDYLLEREQLKEAAVWVSSRISDALTEKYVRTKDGVFSPLSEPFMNAVFKILEFICVDYFEVPFIWVHRRDYFIHHDPQAYNPSDRSIALLTREDLWKIYSLAIKYRAILDRKASLLKLWEKVQTEDAYFDDLFARVESLDEVSDLVDFVTIKYARRIKELAELAGANVIPEDAEVDAVRNGPDGVKHKRATSNSRYERAKSSMVSKFAERAAFPAEVLAQRFVTLDKSQIFEDPPSGPRNYAIEFADPASAFMDAESVINGALLILTTELAKEPTLRKEIRHAFRDFGIISVRPTDLGATKIDEMHPYYAFKYLLDKPVEMFRNSPQFLQILAAETEGLVSVDIRIGREKLNQLTISIYDVYLDSTYTSDDAKEWNHFRERVIVDTLTHHLLPLGTRYIRDWLRDTEEDFIANRCASKLEERADMAPFRPKWKTKGDVPRVLAISHGQGDIKKDFVYAVCLNNKGRLIDHERYADIRNADTKEALAAHIERLKPDVIVIGGFTPATHRLREDVKICTSNIESKRREAIEQDQSLDSTAKMNARDKAVIDIIYVHDEVARLYQHSRRANDEYGNLTNIARYCVGLARFAQNPVCEYASLGQDLANISYDPHQKLVPKDKLMSYLEVALVNVVNIVGVDINKAVRDPYYRLLLPYVSGLGPRKADGMVKRINAICGGTLSCRADLVKREICTSRIFMDCVAFLRIASEAEEEEDDYDILDCTRIHAEDYHIARKMAADAEDMDEEDIEDLSHPSGAVVQLMENGAGKLDELSLDDFASALFNTQHLQKRLTLYMIRDELQRPYSERRAEFSQPAEQEIFTMLTGETRQTLDLGLIVPVVIVRVLPNGGILCRLDSGITGMVNQGYYEGDTQYQPGQTVQGQVIAMSLANLSVELSLLQQSVATDDSDRRKVQPDRFYDHVQLSMDKQAVEAKHKRAQGRQRRVVNHPNFQNFSAGSAEQYLANMQRGDCVVRPSSRGFDHLAITWKVDDGIYQHIDVLELDKPNEMSLGRQLRIQNKYTYADLDELIVSHVRGMARKVDEMLHSEKYKGSEENLRKWLSTSIMAEPNKSFYGFALDRRRPGNFLIGFLTKGYEIQTWNVTVEPGAFVLQGNADPAPTVTLLCNAFKSTYLTLRFQQPGASASHTNRPQQPSRTPMHYPPQGNMTPYGAGARSPFPAGRPPIPMPMHMPPPPVTGAYIHPSRQAAYR